MKILLAGPWVGEFGWELFCWQAFIRTLSKKYDKTIILGRSGNQFLYEDFSSDYHIYNLPSNAWSDSWFCKEVPLQKMFDYIKEVNFKYTDVVTPYNHSHLTLNNIPIRYPLPTYIQYTSDTINENYDFILHPRNKKVGNDRNWNRDNWMLLVDKLLNDGYRIASIGTNEAFQLDGVDDYRNIPLEDTISLLNRCSMVIGQSSGPMHLASLCKTNHFVWSSEKNRNRYENIWNPFKTNCYFYNVGWQPEVSLIYNEINKIYGG